MADSVSNNEVVRAVKEHHERVEKAVDSGLRHLIHLKWTAYAVAAILLVDLIVGARLF